MTERDRGGGLLGALRALYDYAFFYSSLALLGLICLSWSLLALPLYFVLPQRPGTAVGRYGIMAGFRLYSWWMSLTGAYRLDLRAIDTLRGGPALILAPNHPCLLDALLILTRHRNLACVMKAELFNNLFLGSGSRLARYIRNGSPLQMIREAVADLRNGGILLLFPEGTRTTRVPLNALKASIGVIAKQAHVPVQTLIIETDSPFLSKGWPLWRKPSLPITYRVRLGRRFDTPLDVPRFMHELEQYFLAELQGALQSGWLDKCDPRLTSS